MSKPTIYTYDCDVCQAHIESVPGESFMEFSDRVYDTHTYNHILDGAIRRAPRHVRRDVDLDVNSRVC